MEDFEKHLKALMLRGLDGDAQAHRQCLTLLRDRLRAYFGRRLAQDPEDSEDLVQEALLAVHARRATYDRSLPVTAWVYAIARYKLIDYWRRRKVRFAVPLDDVADFLAARAPALDDGLDLTRALQTLHPRQRALVEDVKIGGLSLAEAGARRGYSEGAAKVALHRALKLLSTRMSDADG